MPLTKIYCMSCGTPNPLSAKFCQNCGTPSGKTSVAQAPVVTPGRKANEANSNDDDDEDYDDDDDSVASISHLQISASDFKYKADLGSNNGITLADAMAQGPEPEGDRIVRKTPKVSKAKFAKEFCEKLYKPSVSEIL